MHSSLFTAQNVIVQGITGSQGAFHTRAMTASGTHIVAGVSPRKAGRQVDGIPVYATIADVQKDMPVDISVIFVPAPFAKSAICEAVDAGVALIVCITEGIPIHDMLCVKQYLEGKRSVLIGPNCPGVLLPGTQKLGIIPASMGLPGAVGVVSRSGTLTYEAMAGLSAHSIGQKYVIGIGGDPIKGAGFVECLALFQSDPQVEQIVMIGEIGGTDEIVAATYMESHITKPVFAYVAGHHAPAGVQLGHAGAILGSAQESAGYKTQALQAAGVSVATSISGLVALVSASR